MNKIKSEAKKIMVLLTLIVVVIASMSFVVSIGGQSKIETVAGASIFPPSSVSQQLNVTLSHLSYTTEPPAFLVNSSNYAQNATYTAGSQWVINATYQIFQHNSSVTGTTASSLDYNVSHYLKSPTEYFADAKLGFNGTGIANGSFAMILSQNAQTAVPSGTTSSVFTASSTPSQNKSSATSMWIVFHATKSGSSYTYNATLYYWYLPTGIGSTAQLNATTFSQGPSASVGNNSLSALNMYEIQWNLQPTQQQISIIYTNNGTVAQQTPVIKNNNVTRTPYLAFDNLTHASYILTPSASVSSGLLFDWMYIVDKNTISYPANRPVSFGMVAGSSSYMSLQDPFDPTSTSGNSHYQAPNATVQATNAQISNSAFSTTYNQSDPMMQNATGLNNSLQTGYNGVVGARNAITDTAFTPTTNATANVTEVANSWNTQYVKGVLEAFLKNYAAQKASKALGTFVSASDITLVDFRIGSIFLDTNYTSSAATALRNGLDNEYAALLANNNLGIVNPNTNAIVAGAYAGDFYSTNGPVVPTISNGMIVDPVTGHEYTLSSAGFSAGAYISAGSVVVPQFQIAGWTSSGSPIFAETFGFSFGSLFGGLTSAGSAVSNWFQSGASTITNGIGSVAKTVSSNVIQPINSAIHVSSTAFNNELANVGHSILGSTGVVRNDITTAINKAGIFGHSTLNSVGNGLASIGSDTQSALMAGYNGVKTGIYSLGGAVSGGVTGIGNGLHGVGNAIATTAGKVSSTATGALSTVYDTMGNVISGSAANIYSTVTGASKTALATLDSVGTTFTKTASGAYDAVTNTMGKIGSDVGAFGSSITGAFGAMAGLPSDIVHIIIYSVIIVVAFVGIIIAIMMFKKKSGKAHPGEMSI